MADRASPLAAYLARTAKRWRRDGRGNVAITFALSAVPLIGLVGAALDYSRAGLLHSALQAGTDAAVLNLCSKKTAATPAEMKLQGQQSVQALVGNRAVVTVDDPQVTNSPRTVTLTARTKSDATVLRLANQAAIDIVATARCSASEAFFEIALVLDTTGSMSSSSGSGQPTKMEAAKTAARDFVDYMFTTGAQPGKLRMSLVPFAASVALPQNLRTATWLDTTGSSPIHWQYVANPSAQSFTSRLSVYEKLKLSNADWGWEGCVESPPYPYNVKDDPVSSGTAQSLIVPMFAPDEVGTLVQRSFWGYTWSEADTTNSNSYIDDGSSSGSGSCRSDDSSTTKRFTQACKYAARKNVEDDKPGPNWGCTSRPFSVLGTSQATLKTEITALQPSGSTNIHEGLMWGWRTISSTSVFSGSASGPVAYGTTNYNKVIVLMSDGANTWNANANVAGRSDYSAYGYFRNADGSDATASNSRFKFGRSNLTTAAQGRAAIDELTAEACANAKAKGVKIYTVGFSTPADPIDAQGLSLLQSCSSGSAFFFQANDSATLISAFDRIGQGIGALRLTR